MVLGEIGNFSAYGFSPASLVAPLGTTTVIGMCLSSILKQNELNFKSRQFMFINVDMNA